jgi:lysophospholipase L1-like esterase
VTRLLVLAGRPVAAALALVLFAALIEGGARFAWCLLGERRLSFAPREPAQLIVRDRDRLYRLRPGFDGPWGRAHPVRVRVNSLGMRGPERALASAPGTTRVLVLGDSQTFGFDVPEAEAYPEVLGRRLAADSARFEVWNAAVPGYSTYQGLLWLRQNLATLRPGIVIAAFNFNDRLLAGEPTGGLALVRHTPGAFRAAWRGRWLERSFVVRKLRSLLARAWQGNELERRARFQAHQRQLLARWDRLVPVVTRGEHEAHLRAMAELCRANGVALVLVGLPEHPALAAPLDSAAVRLAAGERTAAVEALRGYFTSRDSTLLWTWSDYDLLANALARRAWPAAPAAWPHRRAPANLVLATALGYNRLAARVAQAEAVPFVDATAALSAHPEVFMDECHLDARGHAIVAELLAPVVRAATP